MDTQDNAEYLPFLTVSLKCAEVEDFVFFQKKRNCAEIYPFKLFLQHFLICDWFVLFLEVISFVLAYFYYLIREFLV